jgi:SnoaL-like domain
LTSLDGVSARLRALEAESGVRATLRRYGHSLDYGAEDDWVDCFVAQAHYEVRQRGGETSAEAGPYGPGAFTVRSYHGRDELAAFAGLHTRAPERFHKHLVVDPFIAIDGDRATAVSYFVRLDDLNGMPTVYAFGRYLDELVRCGDGRWRFAVRIAEVESRHPRRAPRRGEPGA